MRHNVPWDLPNAKTIIIWGKNPGLQRHTNGGQTIRSILSLAIITGNLGKPGAGFNYANLQRNDI
ncbi:MAG TPA: hypothetical protein DDY34_00905 [Bacteroidales bacterium]|nr:hypothetical protein [Bacteroidales bacterium]HBH82352.1 hypothetical protein [Bacteroidales bacterium]HBQ84013.1 hypothetical protein [Bacteroidales bacterium]HCU18902.1 hypothetical protein [Bacteroidales bacterium]